MNYNAIDKAILLIQEGATKRVDLDNVIVYKVGTVIRIDIKGKL